jgi:alpha/beta hydrolase fold
LVVHRPDVRAGWANVQGGFPERARIDDRDNRRDVDELIRLLERAMHDAAHEGQPIVRWLESIGLSAEVLEYPLNARRPKPLESVRTAVRAARAAGHQSVGLVGFSAGGHLAGHAALTQSPDRANRVDFAILGYPIVSMQRNVYPTAGETLLGTDASPALKSRPRWTRSSRPPRLPYSYGTQPRTRTYQWPRHIGSPQHSPGPGLRTPPTCSHTDRTVSVSPSAQKTQNSGRCSLSGGYTA